MVTTTAAPIELGPRLRAAREHNGISRTEAAYRIGKSHESLVAYERGSTSPPLTVLLRLAAMYGTTTAALLGEEGPR